VCGVQLQLAKLRSAAGEMSSASRSQHDDARRVTSRLLRHVQATDQQLAQARDTVTSLRQEAETVDSRLKSAL